VALSRGRATAEGPRILACVKKREEERDQCKGKEGGFWKKEAIALGSDGNPRELWCKT